MAPVTSGPAGRVFVGRAAEAAALDLAYRMAVAEGAAVAVVAGAAGIGKSRLVDEFTAGLPGVARRVAGHCLELGADSLPFAPFVAVVRRLVRDLGSEAVRTLLGGRDPSLARWLPELGPPAIDHDALHGRSRLFDEVLTLLEGVGAQRPLVVVLEDLHWADPASLELLAFLVRNLEQPGVLLVCTCRPVDRDGVHPLRPLITDITRRPRGHLVEPAPLRRADVARQLAGLLGTRPDRGVVARVHERSEGNPLFVEALAADPDATPAPLHDQLTAAMARLPEVVRSVLRAAAVVGREVEHALLAEVAAVSEQELDEALRALVDRGLLVVREDGYVFRQALFREAVHRDLLPGERRRLHGRCAQAIERDRSLAPGERPATEMAVHWSAAGNRERTLAAAWEAAAEARHSYAHEQQLQLLERVLAAWDAVPDAAARLGVPRAVVLHEAADACLRTGLFARGIELATTALDELDRATDPDRAARLLTVRGLLARRAGHRGDADLEAALRVMPAGAPPELRGHALALLAVDAGRWNGDRERAARLADEALHLARAHDLPAVQATALIALGRIRGLAGDAAGAVTAFRAATRAAEAASDHYTVLTALLGEAYTLLGTGDHSQTVVVAGKARAVAHRVGQARSRGADLAGVLVKALRLLGRWAEAREVIEDALADDPPAAAAGVLLHERAEIALAQGDLEAATAAAERSASLLAGDRGSPLPVLVAALHCRLAIATGDLDDADRILGDALADPALQGPLAGSWAVLRSGARLQRARAAHTGRGRRDLPSRTEQLRRLAHRQPTDHPLHAAHRAAFDAEIGALDPLAWESAVSAWRALGQPHELAHALLGAAEAALLVGDRATAEDRLREAASVAGALAEAAPLRREIERLAARGRLDTAAPGPPQAKPEIPFGLTPRELDVLRLLTEGRTNSEIAAALFMSPSTAGVHVSRILGKLGAGRRTEAAAIAHRTGLFDPPPERGRTTRSGATGAELSP